MPDTRYMTRFPLITALLILVTTAPAMSQEVRPEPDPFGDAVFAPDLVMRHARQIQLRPDQRDAITAIIQELQGQAVALQLQMVEEMGAATQLLELTSVDEDRTVAAFQRVLDLEQQVKTTQLVMLIRIKNTLSPAQQQQLQDLRRHPEPGSVR